MKSKFLIQFIFYSILVIILLACDTVETEIHSTGKINEYNSIYVIETDDNRAYEPVNLSSEFKTKGIRVEFKGVVEKGYLEEVGLPRAEKIRLTFIKKIG